MINVRSGIDITRMETQGEFADSPSLTFCDQSFHAA
jgi:hypothetical protein